jgi:hypothetical protein
MWGEDDFEDGVNKKSMDIDGGLIIRTHHTLPSKIHKKYPNAYVICIHRDILDALTSLWYYWKNDPMGWCWDSPPGKNIKEFIRSDRVEEDIDKRIAYQKDIKADPYPQRTLNISFEEMAEGLEPIIRKIYRFLDIPEHDKRIEWIVAHSCFKIRSGGREAGEEDEEAFLRQGLVGDHVNHLDKDDIDLVKDKVKKKGGEVRWQDRIMPL